MAFSHDDYDQFFVAVKQKLYMECADLAMVIYLVLGAHYIFNLSYHSWVYDLMRFIQERIADIPSDDKGKKSRSPVATSHINGLVVAYDSLKIIDNDDSTQETTESIEIQEEYEED